LGQIVFPILIERILTVSTWRTGAMTLGIAVWATALVPTALLLRRRPEDHGWLPDGAPPDLRHAEHERQAQSRPREVSLTASETLRVPAFYLIASAVTLQSFVTTGINFHWFSYLTDNGLSGGVAVISLSLSPLAGMPAAVVSGFIAEKVPTQFLMAGSYVLMAVSFVMLLYADTALMAYAFGITFGIAMGVMITIMQVIWADYFGRGSIGAIRGLVSPVHMLSNALGPLVAAFSFDRTGSYELIFTISVAMSLLAAVLIVLARKPRTTQHAERPESSEAEV
jgi:sugar phosphate permease